MEVLRVEHLTKNFDGVQAVSDVSFTVFKGERLGIIGPNGAGKTTLFNLLNGQLKPSRGRIFFLGKDITKTSTQRRAHLGQARSFQLNMLFPTLMVLDNMLLAIHGIKSSRFQIFRRMISYAECMEKAKEVLESVDLWEKRRELTQFLSYGEQRKLEIALSLASNPRLLLLDEPSAGLTAEEGSNLLDRLHGLGRDITVVVIGHDMDLVFGIAERVMVLHYGEIIAVGTPDEIQEDSKVREIYIGMERDG
jgi:branched-chain amino acid transport system ATP-binding protein